jgi:hypothetical protein
MDESKIRQIFQSELKNYSTQNMYSSSRIPVHIHNGIDSVKISESDLIRSNKFITSLVTTLVTGGTEIDTLTSIPNINRVTFMGFAADNASGSATKRVIINGQAEIGQCYFTDSTHTIPDTQNIIQMSNFMYVNSTDLTKNRVGSTGEVFCAATDEYSSVTTTANLIVGATSAVLSSVWGGTSGIRPTIFSNGDVRNVTFTNGSTSISWVIGISSSATTIITALLLVTILSYNGQNIILTTTIISGWKLQGNIILT